MAVVHQSSDKNDVSAGFMNFKQCYLAVVYGLCFDECVCFMWIHIKAFVREPHSVSEKKRNLMAEASSGVYMLAF